MFDVERRGCVWTAALVALALFTLQTGAAVAAKETIRIGYIGQERAAAQPVSPLDEFAADEGGAGARLGIADSSATGRFIGQSYLLMERPLKAGEEAGAAVAALAAEGARFVVANLDADLLRKAADAPEAASLTILNARAPDDALRGECRKNLLHTIPSRAMLADGLAQYLV